MASLVRLGDRVINLDLMRSAQFGDAVNLELVGRDTPVVLQGEDAEALHWWLTEGHAAQDLLALYRAAHPARSVSYADLQEAQRITWERTGVLLHLPEVDELTTAEYATTLEAMRKEYVRLTGGEAATLQQMDKLVALAKALGKEWQQPKLSAYGASVLINQWAVERANTQPLQARP